MSTRQRPRQPARRSFTLLEIVVSLVLTAVIVLVMVRWVGLSADLSNAAASNTGSQRSVTLISSELADDFENAVPCDGQRRSSMFAIAGPARVVLFRDVDDDGNPERVTWALTGPRNESLTRSVSPTNGCDPAAGAVDSVVVTDRVRPGTTSIFVPRINGAAYELDSDIACTSTPTLCNWQAIGVRLVLDSSAAGERPTVMDEVFQLNWKTVRLPLAQVGMVSFDGGASQTITASALTNHATVGDLDIQAQVRLDDWTPGTPQIVVSRAGSTAERSYAFGVNTDARLLLQLSSTGAGWTDLYSSPVPFVNGQAMYIRVVIDLDTEHGMSGAAAKFFYSVNGVDWTAAGSQALGRFRLYNPDSPVVIGQRADDGSMRLTGEVFGVSAWTTANVASNGWFTSASGAFADGWAGYSSTAGLPMSGTVGVDGPDGNPFQRVSWTAPGDAIGLSLTTGLGGGAPANNCENAWAGGSTSCLFPSTRYKVSYYARAGGNAVAHTMVATPAAADLAGGVTAVSNPSLSTSWQRYEFDFTTASTIGSGRLYALMNGNSAAGDLDVAMFTVELLHPEPVTDPRYTTLTPPYTADPLVWSAGEFMKPLYGFQPSVLSPGALSGTGSAGETWVADSSVDFIVT